MQATTLPPPPSKCQGRGERDIAALVTGYSEPLLRYVTGLTVGDKHLAEDIVQETLLRAWQHPETRAPERGSIRPWLFTVARNLVCDHYRRQRARATEVPTTDALTARIVNTTIPRDPIEDTVAAHDMRQVLAMISPEHRAVLVEIYYNDRRLTDAAVSLNIPLGTVKSRVHYALRALRDAVRQHDLTSYPQAA